MKRLLPSAALLIALGTLVSGCGSSSESSSAPGAKAVSFKITDAGCDPHDAKIEAGPVDFEVESESSSVTEIEVLDGESILGEKENMTDGLRGGFSLNLEAGEYTLRCNGGSEEDGTLTVTGSTEGTADPKVEGAIASYRGSPRASTGWRRRSRRCPPSSSAPRTQPQAPDQTGARAGNATRAATRRQAQTEPA